MLQNVVKTEYFHHWSIAPTVFIHEKGLLQSKDVISLSKYRPYNMIAHFSLKTSGYSQSVSLHAYNRIIASVKMLNDRSEVDTVHGKSSFLHLPILVEFPTQRLKNAGRKYCLKSSFLKLRKEPSQKNSEGVFL